MFRSRQRMTCTSKHSARQQPRVFHIIRHTQRHPNITAADTAKEPSEETHRAYHRNTRQTDCHKYLYTSTAPLPE